MFGKKRRMDEERHPSPKQVQTPMKQARNTPQPTVEDFHNAQKEAALCLQHKREGSLKERDYIQAVSKLAVRDHDGREWIPSGDGRWYYYDGAAYHKGMPHTLQAASRAVGPNVTSPSSIIQSGRPLPASESRTHAQKTQQPRPQQKETRDADASWWQAEITKQTHLLTASQQEVADLKTKLSKLTEEVQKLRETNRLLDQQLTESQALGVENLNLREQIERLKMELTREKETLSNTAEQNRKLHAQLQEMEILARDRAQRVSELETEKLRVERESKRNINGARAPEAQSPTNPVPFHQIQSLEDVFRAIGKS